MRRKKVLFALILSAVVSTYICVRFDIGHKYLIISLLAILIAIIAIFSTMISLVKSYIARKSNETGIVNIRMKMILSSPFPFLLLLLFEVINTNYSLAFAFFLLILCILITKVQKEQPPFKAAIRLIKIDHKNYFSFIGILFFLIFK